MNNSRLSRKIEQQSRKRLFYAIVGIAAVLFLLFRFGIPLLINFSLFLSGRTSSNTQAQTNTNNVFVAPPILDPIISATFSAQIKVTGTAAAHEKVTLYVNDNKTDEQDTKSDGTFLFNNVSLSTGNNTIKAQALQDANKSDYSNMATITVNNKPPQLTVDQPQDGQSFSKDNNTVTISGKTDPDVKITVNDFWAIVDESGNYSYVLKLQNGDNPIKVMATDQAGNKTEKDLKVTYNQ